MEPPKKDNVLDMMEKVKEKLIKEHPDIKKLMEADYEDFKAMVAYAIVHLFQSMITINGFYGKMAKRQMEADDRFWNHSHGELGSLKFSTPPFPEEDR